MKNKMITGLLICLSSGAVHAEMGVNFMIGYNYQADIGIESGIYTVNDPGDEVGGEDHFYDNGFNLVDSSGNALDVTTYWSYDDASQYNSSAQAISMDSRRMNVGNTQKTSASQDQGQPGLEFWWKKALMHGDREEEQAPAGMAEEQNKSWSVDIRAALRWQRIVIDAARNINALEELVTDVYDTAGATPPSAPFTGTFSGPNMALGDTPVRTITPTAATTVYTEYEVETSIFALDVGPAFTAPIGDNVLLLLSGGLSLAYCRSEFDAKYDDIYLVTENSNETLFGGYLSFDAVFSDSVSIGLATYQLQDLELSNDGNRATIDFSNSFNLRLGVKF